MKPLSDFRTRAPFSAFWTEVLLSVPLLQTIYNRKRPLLWERSLHGADGQRRSPVVRSLQWLVEFASHKFDNPPKFLPDSRIISPAVFLLIILRSSHVNCSICFFYSVHVINKLDIIFNTPILYHRGSFLICHPRAFRHQDKII